MSEVVQGSSFPRFCELPAELRNEIWRQCLPHRVVELDQQQDELVWEDEPPCPTNWKITCTNSAPPLLTRVCRESRAVSHEGGASPIDTESDRFGNAMAEYPWLDPARDLVVHLNWEPFADIESQSYDWGDPLRSLMRLAAQTSSDRTSFMVALLQTFAGRENPDEPHEHYRWTRSELVDLLRTRSQWAVVVLPPVVIHADVTATDGLFGLLGDARVQIVEEEAYMERFLALGLASNVTVHGTFTPEDWKAAKDELEVTAKVVFRSPDLGTALQPSVMFRLCTNPQHR
ncbi:hypothetical protein F4808DRAFT_443607 [Astrocystis sublimbata]|nr:hypothetical protein F4808DRAFT_443607 [Astrocystis sublimbata]